MRSRRSTTHRLIGFRGAALALFVAAGTARSAAAQNAPGDSLAAMGAHLAPGALISVRDDSGHRIRGVFREVSNASLILVQSSQGLSMPRAVPLAEVAHVRLSDSRKNGFWIGFAAGAVPGVIFGWMLNQYCYNESPSSCPGAMVFFGGLSGLAGGGLGLALDGAIDHGAVVYARPGSRATVRVQPLVSVGQRGGGASMSIAF